MWQPPLPALTFILMLSVFQFLGATSLTTQPFIPIALAFSISVLSLETLFQEDWEDGTLEWLLSRGQSLEGYIVKSLIKHLLGLAFPIFLTLYFFSQSFVLALCGFLLSGVALLLGAPTRALILSHPRQQTLLPLIILPLGVPQMILSTAFCESLISPLFFATAQWGLFSIAAVMSLLGSRFALKLLIN